MRFDAAMVCNGLSLSCQCWMVPSTCRPVRKWRKISSWTLPPVVPVELPPAIFLNWILSNGPTMTSLPTWGDSNLSHAIGATCTNPTRCSVPKTCSITRPTTTLSLITWSGRCTICMVSSCRSLWRLKIKYKLWKKKTPSLTC